MQIKARLSIKDQFKVQREGAIRQVRRRHKTGPKDYPFELRELTGPKASQVNMDSPSQRICA